MSKQYFIQWRSKANGRFGRGTKTFELEEGQRLVQELNLEYPQIEHELSEAPAQQSPAPAVPETSETSAEPQTVSTEEVPELSVKSS
jgi:hypothetical protein